MVSTLFLGILGGEVRGSLRSVSGSVRVCCLQGPESRKHVNFILASLPLFPPLLPSDPISPFTAPSPSVQHFGIGIYIV